MSDQELAEVFADSDEENAPGEGPAGERSSPSVRPSTCPPVHPPARPSLSRLSPQGCSRRPCHGPATCARRPGPEPGSRAGTRSTSATRSCHRRHRTPSCPPSGRGSPEGGPGTGGWTAGRPGASAPMEPVPSTLPAAAGLVPRRGRPARWHRGPAAGGGSPQPGGWVGRGGGTRYRLNRVSRCPARLWGMENRDPPAPRGRGSGRGCRCPPGPHVAAQRPVKPTDPPPPRLPPSPSPRERRRGEGTGEGTGDRERLPHLGSQ